MRVQVVGTLSPDAKKGNPKAAPTTSPPSMSLEDPRVLSQRGAQHLLILVLVSIASFSLNAFLLRRVFHNVEVDAALGLLFLSAVFSAVSLALLVPSEDPTTGSLAAGRVLAFFFVFLLPGLLIGLLLFAVLPRRN